MADEELMKSLYKSFNTCGKVSFSIKFQAYNQLKTILVQVVFLLN